MVIGFALRGADVKSTPRMCKAFLLLLLFCAACAGQRPLSKSGVTAAETERDRLQCESQMYSERQGKGRGAPNWNLYEYCMRQRGYARAGAH
jgi:hypothetical protein